MNLWQRVWRKTRLGVCAIIVNEQGEILLVKHTYSDGWFLPGGAARSGENLLDAIRRELAEELSLELDSPLGVHGIFFHERKREYISVFAFEVDKSTEVTQNWEIEDWGWYNLESLPQGLSLGAERRLLEWRGESHYSGVW